MKTIDFNIKKKIAAWKLAVKGVSIIPVLYSEQIHNDAIRSNIELWDKNREAVPGRYKTHNSIQTWYDGNTNEFFVYLPHFDSEQELDRVLLEKVTRITGLSGFLGEAAANKAARMLFDGLYPDLQEKLLSESLSLNRDDNNRASAGRHYIASAVEGMTTAPDEKKAFNHWRYIFHNYIERQDPAFWSSLSLDLNLRSNLFAAGLRGFMFNKRENRRISIEGVSAETTKGHLEDLHENVVKDEYVDRGEFIRLGQPSPRFISTLTYPNTATVELPLSSLFADSDGGYSVRIAKPSEGTKWNRHPIVIKDIANLKSELDEPLATFKSKDSHSPSTTLFMLHVANSLKPTPDNIIVVCSPKTINDDPSLGRIQKRGTGRWVNRIDSIYSKDDFSFILLLAEKGLVNYLEPGFEEKWLKPAIERLDRYYTETFKVSGIEKPSREEIEALRGTFAVFSTSNADVYKNIDRSLAIKRERSGLLSEYATYLVAVESATKVVKEFENPKIITQNRILFNIGEVKEITPANHALVEEIASRIRNAGIPTHIVPANDPVLSGAIVPSGRKALGYSNGSEIFLSEDGATAETTIHEYTHVWAEAMRIANPSGWNSIKESLKKLPLWDDIHNDTAYRDILQTEDDVASEVLSRYSGLENAKKLLDNPERKGATAAEQVDAAAQMVNEFWGWNGKNLFGIQSFDSVREVTDRILYDLAMETDLTSARELDIAEGEETVSLLTLEERATLSNPRLKELNSEFNRRLAEMKAGTLNPDYTFNLGLPSIYLRSTGVANTSIYLRARTLNQKSNYYRHPYDLDEIRDLVIAIQKPWAIFKFGDKKKAQNLITGISKGDKHYLVGISITPDVRGQYLEINSIRNVFPRDDVDWLRWIQQGKMLRVDEPKKIKAIINKQGMNYSAIADIDLSLVANIVEKFDNPKIEDISFDLDENIEFTPTPATRVFNDALGVDGFIVYDDPLTLSYFDKLAQSDKPIQVTLGKVYSDIELKNRNLPDNCFQIIVTGQGITERFLMGPGLKLQEQYEDYIAAGLEVPSPFNNHIKYNMENDITSAQKWFKALSFDDLLRCITFFGERIDLSVIPQEKDRVEIQKLYNTISMIGAIPNPKYDHDEDGLGSTTRNVILNVLSSLSADTLSAMRTELSVQGLGFEEYLEKRAYELVGECVEKGLTQVPLSGVKIAYEEQTMPVGSLRKLYSEKTPYGIRYNADMIGEEGSDWAFTWLFTRDAESGKYWNGSRGWNDKTGETPELLGLINLVISIEDELIAKVKENEVHENQLNKNNIMQNNEYLYTWFKSLSRDDQIRVFSYFANGIGFLDESSEESKNDLRTIMETYNQKDVISSDELVIAFEALSPSSVYKMYTETTNSGLPSVSQVEDILLSGLDSMEIPAGVTKVGNITLFDAASLSLPEGVSEIGHITLCDATSLTLPESVTRVKGIHLTDSASLRIPAGVTTMEIVLSGSPSLTLADGFVLKGNHTLFDSKPNLLIQAHNTKGPSTLSDKLSDYMFWAHRHELGSESDPKLIETMKETASRRAFAFTNALHNKVNIQEFVALSEKLDFEKLKATINEQFKDEVDVDIVAAKEDFMSILRLFETSRKSSLIEFNVPKGANGVIGTVNDAAIAALEAYYKNTLDEALLISNNLPSRITEGFKAIAEQSVFAIHLKQGDDVNDFDVVMDFALSLGWLHTGDSILLIDESKPDRYSMEEILIHDADPADPAYETYRQVELDSEKRIVRYISEEDDYRFDAKSGILKAAWSNQIQSSIDLPSAFDKMVKELTPEHLSDMNFLELEGLNLTLDTIIREISANVQLSGVIEPSYERLEEARSSIANSAKAARAEFEQFLERGMRTNNTLIDHLSGNVFKPQYKLPDSYTITKLTLDDELLQHLDSFSYKEAFKAFLKNREINIPIPFDYEANFQDITLEAVDNTTGKTTSLVFINKYNCKSPEVQRSISLILENKNTTVETLAAHDPYEYYEIELKHLGKGSFLQLGKDSIRITEEGVYVFRDEQGKLNWMNSEDYSKRFTQINPPISTQSNHREKYATHIMEESAILELDDTALTQLELIGRLEGPLCIDANTLVLVQKDGHHVITLERELATEIVNDLTKDGIVDIDGIKYHVDADNIRQLSIGEGQYLRPVNDYLTPIYTVLDIKEQQLVKSKPFADVYRSHCARLSALEHQKSQELSRSQENTRANSKGRSMR